MSQMTEEDLAVKHRKERKDLQAQIQSLKKSCTKGDKKKKKELAEEIARLELDLEEKQNKEVTSEQNYEEPESNATEDNVRVSKAQKRRNKKATEEREREERIIEQEIKNKSGPRMKETQKIYDILKIMGLKIFNIPADGNCLYFAISHQLQETNRPSFSVQELREMTADHMRQHKDDYLPFMTHMDEDNIFTEDQYEEYLNTLVKKPVWGGQIEIQALSNCLKCPIKVVQADSLTTEQGEQFNGPPLVLSYHRHLYRLGEHYNSTTILKDDDGNEEN